MNGWQKKTLSAFHRVIDSSTLLLLFLLGSGRILGDRNGWLALSNALVHWQRVGLALLGSWALGRRNWLLGGGWLFGWLLKALPFWARLFSASFNSVSPNSTPIGLARKGQPIRVLTANLLNNERPMGTTGEAFRAANPDLLLFQEAIPSHAAQLAHELSDYAYHCWLPYPVTNMGLGVVSRWPFAVTGLWDRPGLEPFALRITLTVDGSPLDVYCIHLIAPTHQVRRLGLTRLLQVREAQIRQVLAAVTDSSHPAILAGDWNQTEGADGYGWVSQHLVDAWRQVHIRPGWSWPVSMHPAIDPLVRPLLRLDYLFHTGKRRVPALMVHRAMLLKDGIDSDHAPLLVELTMDGA